MVNRLIITILFFCFIESISAQCLESTKTNEYRINSVYEIDSLDVSQNLYNILDHSITLIDSLDIDVNETWIFFAIFLDSRYDPDTTVLTVMMLQGIDYNIAVNWITRKNEKFTGAFCYKGYPYFVMQTPEESILYDELFKPVTKKEFKIYYKNPVYMEEAKNYTYPKFWEKRAVLHYLYSHHRFFYRKSHLRK